MTSIDISPTIETTLPDHTQLPDSDGNFVKDFQEPWQGDLLSHCIDPVLQQLHPDGNYCVGRDNGIYWRLTEPPHRGAEAPDWFYVPNVPRTLNSQMRRSYVLWQEYVAPLIVLEFVSGDGTEERDRTPITGKFWVYEQAIRVPFYGIYEVNPGRVEVYHLIEGRYEQMQPNERGHYLIPPLGVELGIWQGQYSNIELPWLRWWDSLGNLLLDGTEIAQQAQERAQQTQSQLEQERLKSDRLAELTKIVL